MPKVSIILPIYNVEPYLSRCLDSCINQTLKDIEIICVNDGSTDNCLQIIKDYAQRDTRIKIINQKNQGLSNTRINGFKSASGEYILYLDSDDWITDDCCEIAYNQAKENNNDFVYFSHLIYYEITDKYKEFNVSKFVGKLINEKQINLKEIKNVNYIFNAYVWNKLYKRQWLIDSNIHFIDGNGEEDLPYTILVYLNSCSMSYIQKPLYLYRVRKNSLTWTVNINKLVDSRNIPIQYISESKNSGNMLKIYLSYYFFNLCYWYTQLPMNNEKQEDFKNLILTSFGKLKDKDYRSNLYIFLIKSNLVGFYIKFIRKIFVFLYRIPYYLHKYQIK